MLRMIFLSVLAAVLGLLPFLAPSALRGDDAVLKSADPARIVCLNAGRDFCVRFGNDNYEGLLARELARQALLIAAREELSCVTRDVHLTQSLPESGGVELDLIGVAGKTTRLEILAGKPPMQEMLASENLKTPDEPDLAALVVIFEGLSRGSFVQHLQTAGLKGEPRGWSDDSKVPEGAMKLLLEMNYVSQWNAACQLHGEIARHGQSPAVLAALSMAYANLGILTEFHWAPAHDVFTARALLYAQRLVASEKAPERGLSTRAYAYTLAGLFPAALADLDEFAKRSPRDKVGDKLPLANLLRAYCQFSLEELDPDNYKPNLSEIATLFRFLVHDFSQTADRRVEVGVEAMQKMPHCYRIVASLSTSPGISQGHMATGTAPIATALTLYPRVAAIDDLPEDIKTVMERFKNLRTPDGAIAFHPAEDFKKRATLVALLADSNKPIYEQEELTWPVLASLIAEHSFTEIFLRTRFVAQHLGASADDWIDDAQPMYENHPYAPLVGTFHSDGQVVQAASKKLMAIDLDVSEMQSFPLANVEWNVPAWKQQQQICRHLQTDHMDATVNDASRVIFLYTHQYKVTKTLFRLCPEHPSAQKGMVELNWTEVEKNLDEWVKRGEKNPEVLIAFGKKYLQQGNFDKALELVKRACEIRPSFKHYRELAAVYSHQQKMTEWQAALEESLKYPNYGLEQYSVMSEIADYHTKQRRFKEALPFAEGAAQCYSAWGLVRAGNVHESLQNWEEAEKYYRAASERYSELFWFFFVRRTGKGDLDAAKIIANQVLNAKSLTPVQLTHFNMIDGDHATATEMLKANWSTSKVVPLGAMYYVTFLVEQNKRAEASALMQKMLASDRGRSARSIGLTDAINLLARLIADDLAANKKADFSEEAIDKIRAMASDQVNERAAIDYVIGRYYEVNGKKDDARYYFRACMMFVGDLNDRHRTLAGSRLVAMGDDPSEYREAINTGKMPVKKAE